jgi:hypothetical protein
MGKKIIFLMRIFVPSSLKLLYRFASGFSGAHASMSTKLSKFKNYKTSQNQSMTRNTSKFLRTPDANSIPMSDSTAYGNLNAKDTQTICEANKN